MPHPTVDALIIGAGPAGLSAALTLARQARTAVLFSTSQFRNQRSAHMHMVPTWDHVDARTFRAAARAELEKRYGALIHFADAGVRSVARHGESQFSVITDGYNNNNNNDDEGNTDASTAAREWTGRKLILAHGVRDVMLPEAELAGYAAAWNGGGIFHCLFCHGFEERSSAPGASAGVLALGAVTPQHAVTVARMARNLVPNVTIYTNASPSTAAQINALAPGPRISVDERRIECLEKAPQGAEVEVCLIDGARRREAFVAHMPRTELAVPFAAELGCELSHPGGVRVEGVFPETTVKGVFAAGDIATPAPSVNAAVQTGQFAAVGVVQQLAAEITE